MQINKKGKIAGHPILKVRELLRKLKGTTWDDCSVTNLISKILEVDEDTATNILDKFEDEYLGKKLIMNEML
jgi:O-phosphoseryl-tRNA(Cys) synthetase